MSIKYLSFAIAIFTIFSCDKDGDRGTGRYTLCGSELIPSNERISQSTLDTADWPDTIITYVDESFSAWSINSLTRFENENQELIIPQKIGQ